MSNPHGGRPAQVPVEAKQPDDLVERMQGGDVDAFEEFFNTYKRPIYATALAITRDPFLAEEVLQDCFVKAYRVRERLDPARSPLPWLQRVTINLCYSRVSRRKALSEPLTNLITNLVVDLATPPDQVVESREVLEVLQRGIDALPPKQQTAIILYYLHGYSLAEAAEIADCNVGTMKSRLHYALKALRVAAARRASDPGHGGPPARDAKGVPMSCRRIRRELLWLVRFGDFDAGSAPHLEHLAELPGLSRRGRARPRARPTAAHRPCRAHRRCDAEPERLGGRAGSDASAGAERHAPVDLEAGGLPPGGERDGRSQPRARRGPEPRDGADRRGPVPDSSDVGAVTASAPAGHGSGLRHWEGRAPAAGAGPVNEAPGSVVWVPTVSEQLPLGRTALQAAPPAAEADARADKQLRRSRDPGRHGHGPQLVRHRTTRRRTSPRCPPPRPSANLPEFLGVCETSAPF